MPRNFSWIQQFSSAGSFHRCADLSVTAVITHLQSEAAVSCAHEPSRRRWSCTGRSRCSSPPCSRCRWSRPRRWRQHRYRWPSWHTASLWLLKRLKAHTHTQTADDKFKLSFACVKKSKINNSSMKTHSSILPTCNRKRFQSILKLHCIP